MATFNVDSLEFQDDEEARLGTDGDFGVSYDSGNDALEIEDRVNTAIASIPRSVGTDLVGGKFAETVSDGKALADDGSVYDSIQDAVNAASGWVKVGPGTFNESVVVDTTGLTIEGSGERTQIISNGNGITISSGLVSIGDIAIRADGDGVSATAEDSILSNITVLDAGGSGIFIKRGTLVYNCEITANGNAIYIDGQSNSYCVIANNKINSTSAFGGNGILFRGQGSIAIGNIIKNTANHGILADTVSHDSIIYGNRIDNTNKSGIDISLNDCIVAKNRISNVGEAGIINDGTGNVIDSNLTT